MRKNIIIADLDGTISLVEHRRHFVEGKDKDWQAFYKACIDDEPNEAVIVLLRGMRADHIINIFSGREDSVRIETETWLDNNSVPYNSLIMRPTGDYTPDDRLKRHWLAGLPKDQILFVLDDRQKVVDMWRDEGLSCFQVNKGDF